MCARKLGAKLHDIAQGGIALLDKTGWFHHPDYIGMESVYDKVHYNPYINPVTTWDFSKFRPHVVVIAIGQNESHPKDFIKMSRMELKLFFGRILIKSSYVI
ncbi:MAG: hypothetical protein MR777_04665 [Succinatimonas sp.]|nr:hypothetical protein [Succinatimonas sp.]